MLRDDAVLYLERWVAVEHVQQAKRAAPIGEQLTPSQHDCLAEWQPIE